MTAETQLALDKHRAAQAEDEQPKPDLAVLQFAREWQVLNQADADIAGARAEHCRKGIKTAEAWFKPLKQRAQESHRLIVAAEKEMLTPLRGALDLFNGKVHKWQAEERRAAELEARERARIAQQAADDEAMRVAEDLKAQGVPEEEAIELAMPIAESAPPVVYAPPPKVVGVRAKPKRWTYNIHDMRHLCAAIGAGKISPLVVDVSHGSMLSFAKLQGATLLNTIPGIRFYEED